MEQPNRRSFFGMIAALGIGALPNQATQCMGEHGIKGSLVAIEDGGREDGVFLRKTLPAIGDRKFLVIFTIPYEALPHIDLRDFRARYERAARNMAQSAGHKIRRAKWVDEDGQTIVRADRDSFEAWYVIWTV